MVYVCGSFRCMYIYIYTRNAWALRRRCSVKGPHSQSNVVAKVLGNIKVPPPLDLTFIEDLQCGFNSPTAVKLLHPLKIFSTGLTTMMMMMMMRCLSWLCYRAKPRNLPCVCIYIYMVYIYVFLYCLYIYRTLINGNYICIYGI